MLTMDLENNINSIPYLLYMEEQEKRSENENDRNSTFLDSDSPTTEQLRKTDFEES
ncbi:MAG: hypothetical protein VZQ80_04490 [Lachnospiraceae bacterium]|nr:hypothetical protein [Lachnospiraceae bacterium]